MLAFPNFVNKFIESLRQIWRYEVLCHEAVVHRMPSTRVETRAQAEFWNSPSSDFCGVICNDCQVDCDAAGFEASTHIAPGKVSPVVNSGGISINYLISHDEHTEFPVRDCESYIIKFAWRHLVTFPCQYKQLKCSGPRNANLEQPTCSWEIRTLERNDLT